MKRGTVILTPFPFTDLTGNKVRPAIIISVDDRQGNDVIIIFVSSVFREHTFLPTDIPISLESSLIFLANGNGILAVAANSLEIFPSSLSNPVATTTASQ